MAKKINENNGHPMTELVIGYNYIFETHNKIYTGRLIHITGPYTVVIEDAAWIAETGRFHEFIRDGRADGMEIEPCVVASLHWAAWHPFPHKLLTEAL